MKTRPACHCSGHNRHRYTPTAQTAAPRKHTIESRSRCQPELKGGVTSDGDRLGATSHTANCCPRQRNIPTQRLPRIVKPARNSQIPKTTPTSDISIRARTCQRRLSSVESIRTIPTFYGSLHLLGLRLLQTRNKFSIIRNVRTAAWDWNYQSCQHLHAYPTRFLPRSR